jgi:WD repeat and SOF domain-containing protein 1
MEARQRSWEDSTVTIVLLRLTRAHKSHSNRHLPKPVYQAAKLKRTMLDTRAVKEQRRRKHTRAGESKPNAERKKVVIAEQT